MHPLTRSRCPDIVKQPYKFRQFIPAILWFVFLSVLVYLPGSDVPSISWAERIHADKIAHFCLFGMLFILIALPFLKSYYTAATKKKYIILIGVLIILYGMITEIIQHYFIAGRTFDFWDWVADTTGVCVAWFVLGYLKKHLH